MPTDIEVKNTQECIKKIQAIKTKSKARLTKAVLAGSLVVREHAVEKCPYKTGNLRSSIHPDLLVDTETRVVMNIGTDVEYAVYVEKGTSKMAPRPYLQPALDENKDEIVAEIRLALKHLIAQEAAKQ